MPPHLEWRFDIAAQGHRQRLGAYLLFERRQRLVVHDAPYRPGIAGTVEHRSRQICAGDGLECFVERRLPPHGDRGGTPRYEFLR